jgi:hypothetical protein
MYLYIEYAGLRWSSVSAPSLLDTKYYDDDLWSIVRLLSEFQFDIGVNELRSLINAAGAKIFIFI